jgi:hypothetical protein
VSYDPRTNPNAPAFDGHNAGTFLDGSVAFVGIAHTLPANNNCFKQQTLPARVTTNPTAPGAHGECVTDQYDGIAPWYLRDDPNFVWVPTTKDTVFTVPNRVTYNTGTGFIFNYGRTLVTSSNGTKYTVVSKVHLDHYQSVLFYLNDANKVIQGYNFEVLTCLTPATTSEC